MLVNIYQTAQRNILGDSHHHGKESAFYNKDTQNTSLE
jgi:hypothetical protein